MEDLDIDIMVWTETNMVWSNALKEKAKMQLRKRFKQTKVETISSNKPSTSMFRPGGTMIAALGKITGKIIESGNNPHRLGRWTYICTTGKYRRKIYILSAYRVTKTEDGTNTAKVQQYIILKKRGVAKPDPRKQFMEDMTKEVQRMKREGVVVLATDMNSPLLDKDVSNFLADTGLHDLIGAQHGADSPNTQITGSKTINFIFGSNKLGRCIKKCEMLSFRN
eukprot:13537686-Ditylum_brightwellii.AAC.1